MLPLIYSNMPNLQDKIEQAAVGHSSNYSSDWLMEEQCSISETAKDSFKAGVNFIINEGYIFTKEDMFDFTEWYGSSQTANTFFRNNRVAPSMGGEYFQKIKELRNQLFELYLKEKQKQL